jgi:membrane protein required for colicin V production
MNWLDIVLFIVLAVCAFLGFRRGLIQAVLILAGLVLGVFLGGRFYSPFADLLSFIPSVTAARVVAFIIIFIIVIAAAVVAAFLLRKTIAAIKLGWADRVLGALFGLTAGAVICGASLAILAHFFNIEGTVGQSGIASLLLDRVPVLLALLPDEFDAVRSFFE